MGLVLCMGLAIDHGSYDLTGIQTAAGLCAMCAGGILAGQGISY